MLRLKGFLYPPFFLSFSLFIIIGVTMVTKLEKNRNKVIEYMKNDDELRVDKYGNFKYIFDNTLRWHHKKTAVCKQRKIGKKWITLSTHYYKDMVKSFLIK